MIDLTECGATPPGRPGTPLQWFASRCRERVGHLDDHGNMTQRWAQDPGPPGRYTFGMSDQG